MNATPQIGIGSVRHRRLRPAVNAFQYPTWFVLLPLRSLRAAGGPAGGDAGGLPRNRSGWASFHDRDHGDGRDDCLAWAEELLRREGVHDADGEIWLHTYPRVLGYVFKPVSFWYCHRADGSLAAILAEVNNTFGERHVYLLAGESLAWGRELHARKVFHVSPFCDVSGGYRFRFLRTATHTVARIEHDDEQGPLLLTSVSGQLQPLTARALRGAALRMPWVTLGVIVRIHWQAARLFAKRVPFFRKPEAPAAFITR